MNEQAGQQAEAGGAAEAPAADEATAQAHYRRGNVLRERGEAAAAVAAYRAAVAARPDFADAHNNLGIALQGLRRYDEALASYRRTIELAPRHDKAHYNIGNVLMSLGRTEAAVESFRQAIEIRPDFFEAHHNLGNAQRKLGQYEAAIRSYQRALAGRPDDPKIHCNLGFARQALDMFSLAEQSFRQAVALDPDYARAHYGLGSALQDLARVGAAVESCRRAVELDPGVAEFHAALGGVLLDAGEIAAAADSFRRSLALAPHGAKALYGLSRTRKFAPDAPEVAEIEAALADPEQSPRGRSHLHFALAKIGDDRGDYAAAMRHLTEANRLSREANAYKYAPFDPSAEAELFDRLIENYSRRLFRRLKGVGSPSTVPIFIVGMPRSGTSLTEQIVASHPQVFGAGELDDVRNLVGEMSKALKSPGRYPDNVRLLTPMLARGLARRYLDRVRALSDGAPRVTDKMPQNFTHLGLIAILFPKARIIHCRRDPMDTCLSCFMQNFGRSLTFAYDLGHLGAYYRQYERLMAHWRRVLPVPMLEVQYEELIAAQEETSRRIIAFCGLDWDDRCLSFHETERPVRTASNVQVRQRLYGSSVARWKRYEPYLGPLKAALEGGPA